MAEHPDVKRFRQAIAARAGKNLSSAGSSFLQDLLAEDVVWHGTASGKEEVIARWNALAAESGASISGDQVYADGIHAITVQQVAGGSGAPVAQAGIFHVSDGKVTELWTIPTDEAVAESLASGKAVPPHPYMEVFEIAEATRERNTFEPGDIANIHAFLREDVEWHGAGDIPGVKGRDTVIGLYKQFKDATGGSMHLGMGAKFIDDSHAASIVHLTATRADNPDRKMDVMEVNLFHLDEHGKAFEFWGVPADQEEMDAFWLP